MEKFKSTSFVILFSALSVLLNIAVASAADPKLTLKTAVDTKTYSLKELHAKLKSVTVTIQDPVYHTEKTYDGFALEDVFQLLGPLPEDSDEWVFTALDGYAPSISVNAAKKFHPVLTYSEHGKKGYTKVDQGKAKVDPGPFYVIWKEGKEVGEEFPWPYQLASIELVSYAKKFPKLFPKSDLKMSASAKNGFNTFKGLCVRCHSVNLEGGDLAPELNIPKNVTEYWKEDVLRDFIQNATAFRAKSKMPSFEKVLTPKQVDEVIDYLKVMKNSKIQ